MPLKIRLSNKREARAESPALATERSVQLHAPRAVALRACAIILLLLLGAALVGFWLGRTQGHRRAIRQPLAGGKPGTYAAKQGPWGDIVCQRTVMELPPEYLPVRFYESEPTRWFFQEFTTGRLHELLAAAGCTREETAALLDPERQQRLPTGILLQPPDHVVLSLSPTSRKHVYAVLARFQENEAQCDPFHWPADDEEGLFAGAGISAATRAQFNRLKYRHGNVLLFADLQVLLRSLAAPGQRTAVVKSLTRRSAIFASLKVSPRTDIPKLMEYWGGPGTQREVLPVVQAAASIPQGRELSLAALLPPAVRALLFTFPLPGNGSQPNCHWTAFNFFKETPDPPTTNDGFWLNKLKTDYAPVLGLPRYGDILALRRTDGEILHTCVYVADDIVYTKNGVSHWAPWQLTTMRDLLAFYSWALEPGEPLKLEYYRLKTLTLSAT